MRLALLSLLFALASPLLCAPTQQREQQRRGEGGWGPIVQDPGTVASAIPVRGAAASLYAWTREGQDNAKLKKVVFVLHGKGRDPWNYLNHTAIALQDAIAAGLPVTDDEVGIWAPSFWNDQDAGAWPADAAGQPTSNLLVWHDNDWQDGRSSIYPAGLNITSFEALDSVVSYFSNRALFPQLEQLVFSSHSMGSQLLQKYAFLGDIPDGIPSLRFAVGNLGAYTYFDEQRPANVGGALPLAQCAEYNDYRFGLNNVDQVVTSYSEPTPNRDLLLQRFKSRSFHLLLSQNDDGPGNVQCAAKTQGDSHRTRGAGWYEYMAGPMGGWPSNHTLDWIEQCTHDDLCVFRSPPAQRRLFLSDAQQEPSYMPNGAVNNLWAQGSVQWARAASGGTNVTGAMPTGTVLQTASLQTYVPPSSSGTGTPGATQTGDRQQTNGKVSTSAATATTSCATLVASTLGTLIASAAMLLL